MRTLALSAISAYRRIISPYKGFACAYRIHTGGKSCSALGYRAIRRFGLSKGMMLLRMRLKRCDAVYRQHHPSPAFVKTQQGICDAGCDLPCDIPDIHLPHTLDFCNVCDGCSGCDWPGNSRSREKPKRRKQYPRHSHIP